MSFDVGKVAKVARSLAEELIVLARELERSLDNTQNDEPRIVSSQEKPTREPRQVRRAVKNTYDNNPDSPTYDPEPPFRVEPVPPRDNPLEKADVLIKEGTLRVCSKCSKPAVVAREDITKDNLRLDAFEILDKGVDWPNKVDVDKKGGVCVTCPLCGALGLWLIGNAPVKTPNDEGVGSV